MLTMQDYESSLKLETERLCLDFTNTVNWHMSQHPVEELPTYSDLLAWSQKVGLLTNAEAQHLAGLAARRPAEAQAVLERAHALREAVFRLLSAMASHERSDPADLDLINAELPAALSHSQLIARPEGFALRWQADPDALDKMLWPVVYSAADLLANRDLLTRVGVCADDRGCGYLFLDMTKNHSRRWCDMKDCGNRAKARRHYERQREEKA
jgi:predicted RNA-binding Zn ribbon-like protein